MNQFSVFINVCTGIRTVAEPELYDFPGNAHFTNYTLEKEQQLDNPTLLPPTVSKK
jgi:hypothetical protein